MVEICLCCVRWDSPFILELLRPKLLQGEDLENFASTRSASIQTLRKFDFRVLLFEHKEAEETAASPGFQSDDTDLLTMNHETTCRTSTASKFQ
jgi:hypothetical protein